MSPGRAAPHRAACLLPPALGVGSWAGRAACLLPRALGSGFWAGRAASSPGPWLRFQVLECSWDELWNQVRQAQDLDHIIAAHEAFLGTVISRCLLDADSRVRRTDGPVLVADQCVVWVSRWGWSSGAEAGAGMRRGERAGRAVPSSCAPGRRAVLTDSDL